MQKIYIDGLFYKGSGIGRYYEILLKGLSQKYYIVTAVPSKYKKFFEKDFIDYNVEPVYVDYEKFSLKSLLFHHRLLNKLKKEVELFFFPHINIPFLFKHNKILLTVHDMRVYTKFWDRDIKKQIIIKFLYKNSLAKSLNIIAISETTKNDLLKIFPEISNVEVIYNFIDDVFFQKRNISKMVDFSYILYLGNRKEHKNLKNLILAFNKIKNNISQKLVIAGKKEKEDDFVDELIRNLKLKDSIIEIDSPNDEEVLSLYKYANLFLFPSFYEGFGYPPLEALALETPVITSNIPVLKEILGEEIACFNPDSIYDIADNIIMVLNNEKQKQKLLEIGKNRLNNYKRKKIIQQYINLIDKVIKNENITVR